MSLHSYHVSLKLLKNDPPFCSLIMAALRKADTRNLAILSRAFPEVWTELDRRYNAPRLGVLPEDGPVDMDVLAKQVASLNA
jgi:hypothetical protein